MGKIGGQDTRLGAIENIFDYPDYDGWLCSSGINDKYISKNFYLIWSTLSVVIFAIWTGKKDAHKKKTPFKFPERNFDICSPWLVLVDTAEDLVTHAWD